MPITIIAASCGISASKPRPAILRAMGCASTMRGRWPPRSAAWRSLAGRELLPPVVAAAQRAHDRGRRSTSRRANSARVCLDRALEDGGSREGRHRPRADWPEIWRGEVDGIVDHAAALRAAARGCRPATTNSRRGIGGGAADRCALIIVAAADCHEPPRAFSPGAACGDRGAALYRALATQLGHRRFRRSRSS